MGEVQCPPSIRDERIKTGMNRQGRGAPHTRPARQLRRGIEPRLACRGWGKAKRLKGSKTTEKTLSKRQEGGREESDADSQTDPVHPIKATSAESEMEIKEQREKKKGLEHEKRPVQPTKATRTRNATATQKTEERSNNKDNSKQHIKRPRVYQLL